MRSGPFFVSLVVMKPLPLVLFLLLVACTNKSPIPNGDLLKTHQATVFVFLSPDCPVSQSYTLTLNGIYSQFPANDIGFYGVFPDRSSDRKAVDGFVKEYKILFPVVLDADQKMADFFNATKTPEVFAVDRTGNTFYKGAIDNWTSELGQHRTAVTEAYLI